MTPFEKMCARQVAEIEALWAENADLLTDDEMRDLSWAAVERHLAEKRRALYRAEGKGR